MAKEMSKWSDKEFENIETEKQKATKTCSDCAHFDIEDSRCCITSFITYDFAKACNKFDVILYEE